MDSGSMMEARQSSPSKVPEVTLGFWMIKILATTLGETGGDTVTMTLDWGYLAGSILFAVVLLGLVVAQIMAKRFNPVLYWSTIVASTTFGTTMADLADRSLGIGYTGGSALLLACLAAVLWFWYASEGTVSVDTVSTPRIEAFYWGAITFSQTLGTALGDWLADTGGLGYQGGAFVFAAALAVVIVLYYRSSVSRVALFWAAFILTRPLGAMVGDFLDKPVADGGLNLSRPLASAVIAAFIVALIVLLPQRAGRHPGADATAS
ncbi:COG4705 family protein [Methylobacterium brachiatum]